MKRFAAVLLTLCMTISLAACSGNGQETATTAAETTAAETTAAETTAAETTAAETAAAGSDSADGETSAPETTESNVLVAFFSATNTTQGVAEQIADGLGADLYEIVPEDPYTDEDLNYNDDNSRSTIEMNDSSARPAISGSVENMEQYEIVFLGYPIWWGEAPRIVSTFLESYDFSGKTIIPFCTSGGSGIGSSATNLEELTDGAQWLPGQRMNGGVSREEVIQWIDGLELGVTAE